MGVIFEYNINHCFLSAKSVEAEIGTILRVKKPNLFNDLKKGVVLPEQSNTS